MAVPEIEALLRQLLERRYGEVHEVIQLLKSMETLEELKGAAARREPPGCPAWLSDMDREGGRGPAIIVVRTQEGGILAHAALPWED